MDQKVGWIFGVSMICGYRGDIYLYFTGLMSIYKRYVGIPRYYSYIMGMDEYKVYTYVYGELDADDNIIYVGKSNNPRERNMSKRVNRFKILDRFIDTEQRWIHQLSSSGVQLRNKEVIKTCGCFEVGKIYNTYVQNRVYKSKRVRHIPTKRIFESKYAASRFFGMNESWCHQQLVKNNPEWELIPHT